jgi:hypothetical protein
MIVNFYEGLFFENTLHFFCRIFQNVVNEHWYTSNVQYFFGRIFQNGVNENWYTSSVQKFFGCTLKKCYE